MEHKPQYPPNGSLAKKKKTGAEELAHAIFCRPRPDWLPPLTEDERVALERRLSEELTPPRRRGAHIDTVIVDDPVRRGTLEGDLWS